MEGRGYDHRQPGKAHALLFVIAAGMAVAAVLMRSQPLAMWPAMGIACIMALIGGAFMHLQVRDDGDALLIRFGPVPLFSKRVPYAEILAATPAKSRVIDGWGIHWTMGRGWTWNLWGYDCVELSLTGARTLRIGTDEPEPLAAFLRTKVAEPAQAS
jgi:hypothetical protein